MRSIFQRITLAVCLLSPLAGTAQETVRKLHPDVFFGGDFNLVIGTNTNIGTSPLVGYKFNERIWSGVSATYNYMSNSYYGYKTYTYGGSLFTRIFAIQDIYAHAEFELINYETYGMTNYTDGERIWHDGFLVGLGYHQSFGERGGSYISVLWDLNDNAYSPHSNPIIKIGFEF